MIDLIVNDLGGITLAHAVKSLDGYDAILIGMADGAVRLSGPSGEIGIGTLRPAMLEMVRPGMPGRAIRVSGWSISKVSPLEVRIHH